MLCVASIYQLFTLLVSFSSIAHVQRIRTSTEHLWNILVIYQALTGSLNGVVNDSNFLCPLSPTLDSHITLINVIQESTCLLLRIVSMDKA